MRTAGLRGYMQRLPEVPLRSRPLLCLHSGMGAAWAGRTDEAKHLLLVTENCLPPGAGAPEAGALTSTIAYVRSRMAGMRGDLARAIELSHLARELAPASDTIIQPNIAIILAYAHSMRGDPDHASYRHHTQGLMPLIPHPCYTVSRGPSRALMNRRVTMRDRAGVGRDQPGAYRIQVQGWVSDRWREWINGMAMARLGDDSESVTTLTGTVPDQAALLDLLLKLHNLGLVLLEVKRMGDDPRQG